MKKKKFLSMIIMVSVAFVSASVHDACSGGRTETAHPHPLAGSVVYTAWYAEDTINAAVANTSSCPHHLTIATGTSDGGTSLYSSQELQIPERSIRILQFPALKQKTVRGDLKISDYLFVYSKDENVPGLVGDGPIQNIGQDHPAAFLEKYVVKSGEDAVFTYSAYPDGAQRIVLIAKSIETNGGVLEGRVRWSGLRCADERAVKNLKLPPAHEKRIIDEMEANFCFVIDADEDPACTVRYSVPDMAGVQVARIPVYLYTLWRNGGMSAGGGHWLTFMMYNPDEVHVSASDVETKLHIGTIAPASDVWDPHSQKEHPRKSRD
ncbi:MAG: hypothetical protein E4H15_03920 [Syntrophobacterales bacterium]|nr:MAG: hypothetical protein E4H15_03920 [Syntrophobacterales bacterium]